jgi:hypothetical protein
MGGYLPPPPAEIQSSPVQWGDEDHVRGLFPDADIEFRREAALFEAESPEAWLEYTERVLGPIVLAKALLESQGKWDEARQGLVALYQGFNQATDGSMSVAADYLVTLARKPS